MRDGDRRGFWQDRTGQMMLFAGVVLLLSFIALAGAVARINQLATQTVQEQDNPLLFEVEAVLGGIDGAIVALEETHASDPTGFEDNLTPVLDHLKVQESARGFLFSWCYAADGAEWRVDIVLHNGVTRVGISSQESFTLAGAPAEACP